MNRVWSQLVAGLVLQCLLLCVSVSCDLRPQFASALRTPLLLYLSPFLSTLKRTIPTVSLMVLSCIRRVYEVRSLDLDSLLLPVEFQQGISYHSN